MKIFATALLQPRVSLLLVVGCLAGLAGCEGNTKAESSQVGQGEAQGETNGTSEHAFEQKLDPQLIPKQNGVEVGPGLIFAGQPTQDELRAIKDAGGRVLDMRGAQENRGFDETALAQELNLEYSNIPVDRAALEDPAVHEAFRAALKSDADGPLLVHCGSANRVAGLYYAKLVEEDDLPRSEALARAQTLGLTSAGIKSGIDAYLDRE